MLLWYGYQGEQLLFAQSNCRNVFSMIWLTHREKRLCLMLPLRRKGACFSFTAYVVLCNKFAHASWSGLFVAWVSQLTMTADTTFNWIYCVTEQRDGQERTALVWKASFILQGWEDSLWVPRVTAKFGAPGTHMTGSERSRFWFLPLVFRCVQFPFPALRFLFLEASKWALFCRDCL